MFYKRIIILLSVLFLLYIIFNIPAKQDGIESSKLDEIIPKTVFTESIITIAVVVCGERFQEALIMMKSAILLNVNGPILNFIIIAEQNLHVGFIYILSNWQEIQPQKFTFNILELNFPKKNNEEWKSLFKLCASQRLFLPSILHDIDSILYMDTDTIFLSPVTEIWEHFKNFNPTQMVSLSPEDMDKNIGWYNRFAKHPYYGELGVNSGVMLMNLTRMRQFQWEEHILPLYEKYKSKIKYGDQDLINILFFFHPDKLYVLPCEYNYRPDHCMYVSVCNASNGIKVMHGNRGYFHLDKEPAFTVVYNAFVSYQLDKDPIYDFLLNLDRVLSSELVAKSKCGKIKDFILIKSTELFT